MPYKVVIFRHAREKLMTRFPGFPLAEILAVVRDDLAVRALDGESVPLFPYLAGTLRLSLSASTRQGRYQVSVLYFIDDGDQAVEIVDVGIIAATEEG